jgi:serine/threonine protein kinase
MAPDIIQCDENHKYNNSVDFWSLGTVMYELLIGKPPFYNKNYKKLFSEILNGIYSYPKNINISIESISFINGLLQFDPKKRFNWNDIKEHPFIKNNYENFHKLNLHLNIPESDEKLKLIELDSKNYDNFIWIVFQDNNQVGVRLDQINKNIIQNNIKEEYIEKTKDKIDTNKNNNIINNNNNAYDKYSFIDLEKRKKEEAFINDFEELELPDNSFEVVKGYNQYENEKWEIISTESQNLD